MRTNCPTLAATLLACALALNSGVASAASSALPLDVFKTQVCAGPIDILRSACRKRIDEFDRKLNLAYKEAMKFAATNPELRVQQRHWLMEVRDRCTTDACARAVITARVLEFQEIALRAIGRREVQMTLGEQRQICEGIAELSARGEIADRLLPLDDMPPVNVSQKRFRRVATPTPGMGTPQQTFSLKIRRDVDFIFGNYYTGGSCFSSEIRAISPPLSRPEELWPSEEIDPDEQDDVIRWGTWGGGEAVLMFAGRYFIVTTRGPEYAAGIVIWITPIGTRRPICTLQAAHKERTVSFVRDDAALCSASARDELKPLIWRSREYAEFAFDDLQKAYLIERGLPGAGMPGMDSLEVDIDNDGKPDRLVRGQYASGAGCGGSASALYLMTPDDKQLQLGATNDALAELKTDSSPIEIYSYKGSTFVLAALGDNPALVRMSPSSVSTECVFHDQPISHVKTLYPLDGPVRDPARPDNR